MNKEEIKKILKNADKIRKEREKRLKQLAEHYAKLYYVEQDNITKEASLRLAYYDILRYCLDHIQTNDKELIEHSVYMKFGSCE